MTLAQLADARGISKASATRMVRRHKWRRQPGNDGLVRVLVPPGQAERPPADAPRRAQKPGVLAVIEAALSAQARAEARADRLEVELTAARAEVAEARARTDLLQAELAATLAKRRPWLLAWWRR